MDETRLTALLESYLEGRLTPPEQEELESGLLDSSEARRIFWQYAQEHAALVELMGEARGLRLAKEGDRSFRVPAVFPAGGRRKRGPGGMPASVGGTSGRPRRLWGVLAAGLLGASAAVGILTWRDGGGPPKGPRTPSFAIVEHVEGQVYRSGTPGPKQPVQALDRILDAQTFETTGPGSRLDLAYTDGTRLTLEEHSVLQVLSGVDRSGKRMQLDRGALRLEVVPQPKDRPLVIRTPQGSLQVVGTLFRLLVDTASGGRTRLDVDQGKVRLSRADGASVDVSGGYYATIAAGVDFIAHPHMPRRQPGTWKSLMEDFTPPVSLLAGDFKDQNYGMQSLALCASQPKVLYVGTCYQGIYKSTDSGDHWVRINTGENGANLNTGRNWTLAVDPTNPDVVYTVAGAGIGQGIWKSTNGGVDWAQLLPDSAMHAATADVYSISIDPSNPLHVIASCHSGWNQGSDAGILESLDGGMTWILHPPQRGWGAGHYAFFIDPGTWILATELNGFWRTADSGRTWTQVVSQYNMQHGAGQLYASASGALYLGAVGHLLRSTDRGLSWSPVQLPSTPDGYNAIIGDGTYLYAQPANTGAASGGPTPFYISLETDGLAWEPYSAQTFADGPMSLAVDRVGKFIYSSNWRAGVWRLAAPR